MFNFFKIVFFCINLGISAIFWIFFNLGLSYITLLVFAPFCLTMCPIDFRKKNQIIFGVFNMLLMFIYAGILYIWISAYGLEKFNFSIYEVLMDFQCIGNYFYVYLVVTFIPSILFIFKIFIYKIEK